MQAYIDPESKLVKAVVVDKATRLAAAGLEQLRDFRAMRHLPSVIARSRNYGSAMSPTVFFRVFVKPWKSRSSVEMMTSLFGFCVGIGSD
jgi:hypothetical protein